MVPTYSVVNIRLCIINVKICWVRTHETVMELTTFGKARIEQVPVVVWNYEVSGKRVLTQWFSYRKMNRERPIIGDRRPPSALGDIQPDHWLAEYTTELLNVLHVLTLLVELEPNQAKHLEKICAGPLISFVP